MKVLFIGRFQPLHKGHLKIIKDASKNYNKVIIGIGSSQYSNTDENPFTDEERKEMIYKTLKKEGIDNYRIVNIPDIHNPPKWVDHVVSIVSDFDVVLSNNDFTKKLFSEKGFKVKKTKLFEKERYSGKVIRDKIRKDEKWEDLVPEEVLRIIKNKDGIKRIKSLNLGC
ncbi:nicotinamide-nucleotide adenylyltransferase [Thermoplasmatales archaeon SG8-52-2]|nr:MAG: nicotinamide-nucleotide adenylyltransferase [Thermoplasmatales archaeon SG8-52-2]